MSGIKGVQGCEFRGEDAGDRVAEARTTANACGNNFRPIQALKLLNIRFRIKRRFRK